MAAYAQTAANVVSSAGARTISGTSGATITAGMPVYRDASDGNKFKPAIATSEAAAAVVGIALCAASNGQPLVVQTEGTINAGCNFVTPALPIFLSAEDAGAIVPFADIGLSGAYCTILGVTASSSLLELNIFASGSALPV